jgi:transposase
MVTQGGVTMSDLIWLSEAQMRRIEPYFPLSHGVPRVDDRRIVSGIIFVIRNGLRWRDAPAAYGPPKTIYNRFESDSQKTIIHVTTGEISLLTKL